MRNIIFRGKQIKNGQWVYGTGLWNDRDGWYILNPNEHAVDPDTVGQYTGLEDKHGWCIYEGDILKAVTDDGEVFYVYVIWQNFGFYLQQVGDDIPADPLEESDRELFEIVGNIYDNFELWLEVDETNDDTQGKRIFNGIIKKWKGKTLAMVEEKQKKLSERK